MYSDVLVCTHYVFYIICVVYVFLRRSWQTCFQSVGTWRMCSFTKKKNGLLDMGKPENCCSVQFMILVQVYTLGGVGRWGGEGGGLSISCEYRVPGLCGNWVCWKQHHSIDMQLDAGFECNCTILNMFQVCTVSQSRELKTQKVYSLFHKDKASVLSAVQ